MRVRQTVEAKLETLPNVQLNSNLVYLRIPKAFDMIKCLNYFRFSTIDFLYKFFKTFFINSYFLPDRMLCNLIFTFQLHTSWVSIGKEKLSKWLEVLLAIPPDSGPHICVTFSTLCRHLQQIGDGGTIEQHKVSHHNCAERYCVFHLTDIVWQELVYNNKQNNLPLN